MKPYIKSKLFIILLLLSSRSLYSQESKISITLTLPKQQYVEGEHIFIHVTYKNTGKKLDSLNNSSTLNFDQSIIITNSNGTQMGFKGMIGCGFANYIKLFPQQMFERVKDISYSFGSQTQSTEIFSYPFYFPPDDYDIKIFTDEYPRGLSLSSNTVRIVVSEPDSMQRNELKILREVYRLPTSPKEKINIKRKAVKDFLIEYPNSIYYEQAFSVYTSLIGIGINNYIYTQASIEEALDFINRFPDSYDIGSAVWYGKEAAKYIGGKDNAVKFLQSVVGSYQYHEAGRYAQTLIQENRF